LACATARPSHPSAWSQRCTQPVLIEIYSISPSRKKNRQMSKRERWLWPARTSCAVPRAREARIAGLRGQLRVPSGSLPTFWPRAERRFPDVPDFFFNITTWRQAYVVTKSTLTWEESAQRQRYSSQLGGSFGSAQHVISVDGYATFGKVLEHFQSYGGGAVNSEQVCLAKSAQAAAHS
jgi:hypothetical protein